MSIVIDTEGAPTSTPDIDLTAIESNAFFVMGAAQRAMRRAGATKEFTARYVAEATSGDYNHLLQATMLYLDARSPLVAALDLDDPNEGKGWSNRLDWGER